VTYCDIHAYIHAYTHTHTYIHACILTYIHPGRHGFYMQSYIP